MWDYDPPMLQARFDKNMQFIKQNFKGLYEKLSGVSLERLTLSVNSDTQTIDIFDGQRSLYLGNALSYCQSESEEFGRQFANGAPITTILPISEDNYSGPRFFHKHLNQTINMMDLDALHSRSHLLPENTPMIVFFGVGCGLHIESFLEERSPQIVCIAENDPEMLLISMYLTNWYSLIPHFQRKHKRYFNFILVPSSSEEEYFRATWNEMIRYTPIFPSITIFYNHLRSASRDRVIEKIHREYQVFITAWGFYDDEANQYNNAKLNLEQQIPILPSILSKPISLTAKKNVAVIVGAGPSLNERIDWIKENRDRILLFSAGTALSILKHNGLVPDIHVEIESDYATYLHLSHTLSEDYKVPLMVGAIQLNPKAFQLFDKRIMFFKDSTALYDMFGKVASAQLQGMTPTCTNAATALAIQIGFTTVALFGTDFGYVTEEDSHADGSVYFDKKAPDYIQSVPVNRKGQMNVTSVRGEPIKTEPLYNSARDRLEKILQAHAHRIKAYNCSLGAVIDGSTFIDSQTEFEALLPEKFSANDYVNAFYYESALLPVDEIEKGKQLGQNYLNELSHLFINELSSMVDTPEDLVNTILKLTQGNEDFYRTTRSSLYFLTRGTLWHYLNAGISVAFSTIEPEQQKKHIHIWRTRFIDFMQKLPKHFTWVSTRNNEIANDDWLTKRITEEVEDPFYKEESA